ncbi:multicopper oxidase domain-containing protein [Defluviimonas sp. WL0024]|uniref:Multicopper oxidase CueO n=1 Tax=Albidovulum salinarum TaxID=2984153 RepID=A0ABT2XF45_9RHOB|nr:multicopper oxidase domain-containing protein [Defluviimonas sp. WL0024]MCU9850300.1 multicopper oxidase domain-containing protein [Defluviimonas sp. WL0024]
MPIRPPLSRRSVLAGLTALAAPALIRARPAWATEGLPFVQPPLSEGQALDGKRVFDLSVAPGAHEFRAGVETRTIGINAPFLGPILAARAGETLRMDVANGLAEPMTLHWHGLHLPAAADGGPHQSIAPGAAWQPEFTLAQKAGTFWFHGHQHERTGAHVWAGMAGVIRVADDEEDALPLPRSHGEDDFTLILQDRRFDADGQMPYELNMHDRMAGMQGDVMLVNGQIGPVLELDAPLIRLRILNGANGSFYGLSFSDERTFHQIASDGGLLAAPVAMRGAILSPGERGEYLVDLSDGAAVMLRAETFGAEVAMMGITGTHDVLEIRPRRARAAPPLPDRLAELPAPPKATGAARDFELAMTGMGMMGDFTINGRRYDHGRIDFSVPLGATETWTWTNRTPMLHPIHIHDVQFRILSRNGQPPAAHEAGLKDTVLIRPDETVALGMSFQDYADPELPYMYHCHILEHEDAGMMGQFTVV